MLSWTVRLGQDIEGSLYPLKSGLRNHINYKSTCCKNKGKMGTYDKGTKAMDGQRRMGWVDSAVRFSCPRLSHCSCLVSLLFE